MKNLYKNMTFGDAALIAIILISSMAWILYLPSLLNQGTGKDIVVTVREEQIFRYPLKDNVEENVPFDFEVKGKTYTGILEIKDGSIRLQRLPEEIVPLEIHKNMGWINSSYQVIVALPIHLIVTIEISEDNIMEHIDFINR